MADFNYQVKLKGSAAAMTFYEDIESISIEESVDKPSVLTMRVGINLNDDGTWTYIEDSFQPFDQIQVLAGFVTSGSLSNALGGSSAMEILFDGYVVENQLYIDQSPDSGYVDVVAMDASVLMGLNETIKAWPAQPTAQPGQPPPPAAKPNSDSDIVGTILDSYGLRGGIDITDTTPDPKTTVIFQRCSDLEFVQRLARKNGREFFFQAPAGASKALGYWQKPALTGTPQKALSVRFGPKSTLTSLTVRTDNRLPQSVSISQVDAPTGTAVNAIVNASTLTALGSNRLSALTSKPAALLALGSPTSDQAEMTATANAILDRSSWFVTATGEVNTEAYESLLRPRLLARINGAGKQFSGNYYVTQVTHTIGSDGSYDAKFEASRNATGIPSI